MLQNLFTSLFVKSGGSNQKVPEVAKEEKRRKAVDVF
jgi:hypothetical protein